MKVLTETHISAGRVMPRKAPVLWLGEKENKRLKARAKRERNIIARFYRTLKTMPEEGNASLCHRHRVVTTGIEARLRLKNLLR